MTSTNRLNKHLWTNITRLRLYAKGDKEARFILRQNPFDDDEEENIAVERDEYIITGQVFPETGIYRENGFGLKMLLTSKYPDEPPVVQLITPVYHPNIEKNGTFCHQLLNNGSRWKKGTTLVDIVRVVVQYLNKPDLDYAANFEIAKEYMQKREEYDRKALKMIQKSSQSRR